MATQVLAEAKFMYPELKQTPYAPPTVTLERRMTIELGGRKVEISFLGRGNTSGDAVIYVPDATVLIAGDLRVAPTPFAIGSLIDEWIVTMKALAAIDATTTVPGHGSVEHDKQYMLLVTQALESPSQPAPRRGEAGTNARTIPKSADMAKFRSQLVGSNESRGRHRPVFR